ncbi:hypothetical protein QTG54_008049 [Skeletonema marinoi]|uniref:Uncharacterized protein n=1 Tax=Skeletonema marinoi TaxID=267567 RepID=A0AAD8YA45_9STRA|nr:hypothetical protein QTG54_008049 [Skeletonema marinoi]
MTSTMMRILLLLLLACTIRAFQTTNRLLVQNRPHYALSKRDWRLKDATTTTTILSADEPVDFTDLMVMDVVLFQRRNTNSPTSIELGSVQENGNIAPLSTWTLESAYTSAINDMMEFVVDEEDLFPGMTSEEINVLSVLDGDVVGYGSRQVGGGKGPGNPHGEESEIIYYVDRAVVEGVYSTGVDDEVLNIDVVVNSNLEHLW